MIIGLQQEFITKYILCTLGYSLFLGDCKLGDVMTSDVQLCTYQDTQ